MEKPSSDRRSGKILRIGRSEIRPIRDYGAPSAERTRDGDKIGFIPGGTYQRGKFPALDQALDQLAKPSKDTGTEG